MFRHVFASAMVVFLIASLAAAATKQEREKQDRPAQKQISEKAAPDPESKSLKSSDDPGFAETEEGCAGARVLDYLRRHGNDGVIDPVQMLELTRDDYERRQGERQNVAADSIGGTVWTSLGPTNGAGRITAAATHPSTAGTAIVGAAGGGAWKTTNSGAAWTPLTEAIANLSVGAIAIAPSATNTVYLGTGEGGIAFDSIPGIGLLVSTDGGTNWTLPSSVLATSFYKMSILPTNANELVVGTNAGGLRSTGGQNGPWTTVIPSASSVSVTGYGDVTDIVRDPTNALILYATTFDRLAWCTPLFPCSHPNNFASPTVLKSIDGGVTWNPANTGLPVSTDLQRVNRLSIAIAPSTPATLYVATAILDANTGIETSHVYKTTNSGTLWTDTNLSSTPAVSGYLGTQAWYDNTIVVAPSDANTVLAGGVFYAKTTNGGTTWAAPTFAGGGVHVDAHELRYDTGGLLYICNDGGVWTSSDHGNNVTNRNTNLVTRQFYGMANDPANRNRIFGGQQDNGTIRRPDAGGTSWDFFSGGDGFECAINAHNPSIAYGTIQSGKVVRTSDADAASIVTSSVTPRYDSGEFTPFSSIVEADPADPSIVYTVSTRLWKSVTGGDAWVPLPITVTGGQTWSSSTISALAIARSNTQVIMVGKGGRVYRSADGGNSWTRVDLGGLPGFGVTNLEIHPTDPLTAFVTLATTGTTVYYTTNGGTVWTARDTGLPPFAAQVVRFDPTDVSTLYCGTDVGVYRSTDSGANWSQFGTGLPAVSVYDLEATLDGSLLRAATHGRGIWELNVTGATNNAPAVGISAPATAQTIAKGASLNFTGTFSDPDGGDSATGSWHFPDDWSVASATSGGTQSHSFHRGGLFPVTLSATDTFGAIGAATVNVTVTESGDACASPIVIPASGPFPYTITVNTLGSTTQGSDPVAVSSCYPFTPQKSIWLSFTPPVTASYNFSLCGSVASAELAGFTGSSCGGPYSEAFCLIASSPGSNCATATTTTASLTGGTPYRIMLSNYFSNDFGEISLTITQSSNFTPVVNTVSRAVGSASGGTSVVIHGSGFTGTPTVTFGGTAATSVALLGVGTLTAITPAHTAGIVDVRVTNPSTAFGTLGSGFTYTASALAAPTALLATATSTTSVNVTWNTVVGATGYEVLRSTDGTIFTTAGTPAAPPFPDAGRSANTSYLYKVRATGPGGPSLDSNLDAATTTIFTDDPLTIGNTIKIPHVIELRTAVNAMANLAGIGSFAFTDPGLSGVKVKALHITELRTVLNNARLALGLSSLSFTNTLTANITPVRALDLTELRNGVK
jgi:photosystem II stability/assembly factor-like uncharacterized protein